jgi:predicted PhzF superfamily epimerase YddE/YHI9
METMSTSITWVDAFTDRPFAGNPAAVCLPDSDLSDEFMQSLAFELGISETAYVSPTGQPGHFNLRWFSPATEIDLCGHATLASAHAMRERGVSDGVAPLTFHTRSGPLVAAFEGDRIALDFPASPMAPMGMPQSLVAEWGPSDVVAKGRTEFFAVVVLSDAGLVRDYQPDMSAIAAVDAKSLLITARADDGSGADYVLRVFGPNVGIAEDSATGSAQCVIGPYWAEALGQSELVANQVSPRGATLYVRPDGERVHIAGHAVTVHAGHLC